MKYKDLYPKMKMIEEEHKSIIRSAIAQPCCICGEPTEYCEINYEAFFCSEECLSEMDAVAFQ